MSDLPGDPGLPPGTTEGDISPAEPARLRWSDLPDLAQQTGLTDYLSDNIDDLATIISENNAAQRGFDLKRFAEEARAAVLAIHERKQ